MLKIISIKSFLFFAIVLMVVAVFLTVNLNKCTRLTCVSMNGLKDFRLKETYEENNNIFRALFEKKDELLRVEVKSNIASNNVENIIKAETVRMKTLFANATSPYPGEVSNEIVCSKEFVPQYEETEVNGVKISYFTGYLNQRLVFGACTPDQTANRGVLALFYCPKNKQLFQVELIWPADKFNQDIANQNISSIKCK